MQWKRAASALSAAVKRELGQVDLPLRAGRLYLDRDRHCSKRQSRRCRDRDGIFATGVAVSVLLIASHDRPFSGEISVKPASANPIEDLRALLKLSGMSKFFIL